MCIISKLYFYSSLLLFSVFTVLRIIICVFKPAYASLANYTFIVICYSSIFIFLFKFLQMERSVSSFVMGAVWLIALTNEEGGKQLGRFILYYGISIGESLIIAFLWSGVMNGSGDYFAYRVRQWFQPFLFCGP